ncbi:translational elongation factor EF-1 alpha [Ceratobasidium sp. 395]|nr:translational elongation factor EF-1 alpha [Ceratobasidium sp. 395]
MLVTTSSEPTAICAIVTVPASPRSYAQSPTAPAIARLGSHLYINHDIDGSDADTSALSFILQDKRVICAVGAVAVFYYLSSLNLILHRHPPNSSQQSTHIKLLIGNMEPSEGGEVWNHPSLVVGYAAQDASHHIDHISTELLEHMLRSYQISENLQETNKAN